MEEFFGILVGFSVVNIYINSNLPIPYRILYVILMSIAVLQLTTLDDVFVEISAQNDLRTTARGVLGVLLLLGYVMLISVPLLIFDIAGENSFPTFSLPILAFYLWAIYKIYIEWREIYDRRST